MTVDQAKKILLNEGIHSLDAQIPWGISLDEVMREILYYADSRTLDIIIQRHYGFIRCQGTSPTIYGSGGSAPESDDSYRNRAYSVTILVDSAGNTVLCGNASPMILTDKPIKVCAHSWKNYQGLMESYDYCTHCDEKRR